MREATRRATVLTLTALFCAGSAQARLQGERGRRLEVFASLEGYRHGELHLTRATIRSGWSKREVRRVTEEGIRRYADQFLETRLRTLPWSVHLRTEAPLLFAAGVETLVAEPAVLHESRGNKTLLTVDFFDARTKELVARFSGYGHGVLGQRRAARDDLQEITRVLTRQLAAELRGGSALRFQPDPFRRRSSHPVVRLEAPRTTSTMQASAPRAGSDPAARDSEPRHEAPRVDTPSAGTVFNQLGSALYHARSTCSRLHGTPPRRLSEQSALREGLRQCSRCKGSSVRNP